ncbi:MAG: hypothetical protein LBO06_00360 [Bacteroidales bacterium]|jgi:hypothetical protein|nr:hypothetical protein [Bacteroidales bacterium]
MIKFNINKVLAIALSVATLAFVACADEEEPVNNRRGYSKTAAGDYSQYESTTLSAGEILELAKEFSDALKGKTEMPTMNITNSLLAMETFFNCAVVAKQENADTTVMYEEKVFSFSVTCNDGEIDGETLKEAYNGFLENVLATMGNAFINLSDMRVIGQKADEVTFELRIPRLLDLDDALVLSALKPLNEPTMRVVKGSSEVFNSLLTIDLNTFSLGYTRLPAVEYDAQKVVAGIPVNIYKPYYSTTNYFDVLHISTGNPLVHTQVDMGSGYFSFPFITSANVNSIILPSYCSYATLSQVPDYPYMTCTVPMTLLHFEAYAYVGREKTISHNEGAFRFKSLTFALISYNYDVFGEISR